MSHCLDPARVDARAHNGELFSTPVIPKVSIIILNFNGKQFLEKCLCSIFQTKDPNFEVIFVDNGSSDGSVYLVRKKFCDRTNIKIIACAKNMGYPIGNNIGARYARGEYLIFLNPDTWVEPDWIFNLVKVLESDSTIGIAQAKLLLDKNTIDSVGGELNRYGFGRIRGHNEADKGQYDKISEIFYPSGAAFIIKKKLWEMIGGFDPIYFIGHEDADLGWRVWDSGYRVVIAPEAIVYHKRSAITSSYPMILKYFSLRNRLIILLKNHSLKNLLRFLPVTAITYFLNILRQVIVMDVGSAVAEFKGILWCLMFFREIWKSRRKRIQICCPSNASVERMSKYIFAESLGNLLRV